VSRRLRLLSTDRPTSRWAGRLLGAFVISCSIALVVAAVTVRMLGWDLTVVTSGSMQPRISAGDVVAVRPLDGAPVRPGMVVLFDDGEGRPTLHRVLAVDPDGSIRTKGDANLEADSTPVRPSAVLGRAVMVVPHLGHPALAVVRRDWITLGVFVVVGWLLVQLLPSARRGDRSIDADPLTPTRIATPARPLCAASIADPPVAVGLREPFLDHGRGELASDGSG